MNFHCVSKEANIHHLKSSASFLSQRICIGSASKEATSTVLSPALAVGLATSQLPLPDIQTFQTHPIPAAGLLQASIIMISDL
jgi:hypothetical protein